MQWYLPLSLITLPILSVSVYANTKTQSNPPVEPTPISDKFVTNGSANNSIRPNNMVQKQQDQHQQYDQSSTSVPVEPGDIVPLPKPVTPSSTPSEISPTDPPTPDQEISPRDQAYPATTANPQQPASQSTFPEKLY